MDIKIKNVKKIGFIKIIITTGILLNLLKNYYSNTLFSKIKKKQDEKLDSNKECKITFGMYRTQRFILEKNQVLFILGAKKLFVTQARDRVA
jgi:hypothetical protein